MVEILSMPRTIWLLILTAVFACTGADAAPKKTGNSKALGNAPIPTTVINIPSRPRPLLDTTTVRKHYLDGEFELAIEILETGLKEKRPYNHGDSVFIFKHLGVMYAAKYETRERGKYYMHQLLMTEPTARIMDMYASDMIYMIFKNIQDEFESTRVKMDRAETNLIGNARANQGNETPPKPDPRESGSGHAAAYWIGAGVVTAGVAAYFIFTEEPKTTTTTVKHTVP